VNKESLHLLFSILQDPVCILDSSLIVLQVNDPFLKLFDTARDQVLQQHIQSAFSWPHNLDRIPHSAVQVNDRMVESDEFEYSFTSRAQDYERYLFSIGPILSLPDCLTDEVAGVYILARNICRKPDILADTSRCSVLFQIIHELSTEDILKTTPMRVIQQVLGRLGPVLEAEYLSYIDFARGDDGREYATEIALWSFGHGFLIGEEWIDYSLYERSDFQNFIQELESRKPLIYNQNDAPELLHRISEHRKVSDLLILAIRNNNLVKGCLILWGNARVWSDSDLDALHAISEIIGNVLSRMRVESDLARSVEKFKGVIEYIGDMYYLTDKIGNLLEISPSMAPILGYGDSSYLIGRNMESLLYDPDVWPLFLSDVLNENGVKDYELILQGSGGKIITGSVSCRLLYDDEGDLRGIEGVIRDISRRRQYEQMVQESEWKLEQAQKIARLGVWSYDLTTRHFRVSSEVFSMLYVPGDISALTLDYLIMMSSPKDKSKFSVYFEQMVSSGNPFEFEFRLNHADRKFKHIRIKGQPKMRAGVITGSFGILQDITERKEVEEHLLRYANQLEQKTMELDAMRTQLLDMNRELDQRVRMRTTQIEDLLRQKDEFIMQIGHDLKTPLTPLVAILPYIRKKTADPELCELLDVSIEDVSSIRKMITTVLELAQMNALYTLSDLQDINLYSTINQIISDNAYLIHQKSLTIVNDIPTYFIVTISPMHLETMMGNLISNAVKYSYINGKIEISAYEHKDSYIVIIRDYGVGIEADVLPRIFDEFFRADTSRHDRQSHGLGLSIVRRVVDMYGGTVSAKSEGLGKGSTFIIKLKKNPVVQLNVPMG